MLDYLRTWVLFQHACGTSTLVYLYRQFVHAFRGDIKQIAGYLSLLEVLLVFNNYLKNLL